MGRIEHGNALAEQLEQGRLDDLRLQFGDDAAHVRGAQGRAVRPCAALPCRRRPPGLSLGQAHFLGRDETFVAVARLAVAHVMGVDDGLQDVAHVRIVDGGKRGQRDTRDRAFGRCAHGSFLNSGTLDATLSFLMMPVPSKPKTQRLCF